MNLNRPAPGGHNAGLTPGYNADGTEIAEAAAEKLDEAVQRRIQELEYRVVRLTQWAKRKHDQVAEMRVDIADLKAAVRRIEEHLNGAS